MQQTIDPKNPAESAFDASSYDTLPDQTPRREGGDDALSELLPNDNRADEKVITNEPKTTTSADNNNTTETATEVTT